MKFYGSLFLLLAMFANAQDDSPTGDDIRVSQGPKVTQPVTSLVDDNPSQSDIIENKVNVTIPSSVPSNINSLGTKNVFNTMYIFAMMFML